MINPQISNNPADQFRSIPPVHDNRTGRQPILELEDHNTPLRGWTEEALRAALQEGLDSGIDENFDYAEFKKEMNAKNRERRQTAGQIFN
jgi:hypothetical protein